MTQNVLEVRNLVKRYDGFTAVDDLSFEVYEGEIFSLLGPNGAGKTTTIRAVMDIFKPDEGRVRVLRMPPGAAKGHIGYLPEERGLYRDLKVLHVLVYLAELLILDEPFQGLDPVNVDLLKGLIRELQGEGKTVVLSAHQMNLVEALCDRILLINHGQAVLYGPLDEIKHRYAPHAVRLRTPAALDMLPGVTRMERRYGTFTLTLDGTTPQELLRVLVERNIPVEAFEVATAPLEEIFITVVKEEGNDA